MKIDITRDSLAGFSTYLLVIFFTAFLGRQIDLSDDWLRFFLAAESIIYSIATVYLSSQRLVETLPLKMDITPALAFLSAFVVVWISLWIASGDVIIDFFIAQSWVGIALSTGIFVILFSIVGDTAKAYLIEGDDTVEAQQVDEHKGDEQQNDTASFLEDLYASVLDMVRAFVFVILRTPYVLVPSAAHTSRKDDVYNKKTANELKALVAKLEGLDDAQKQVIEKNWVEQISWTNNRATRERNANELLRWWQIILGVLIPVLTNLPDEFRFLGLEPTALASIAGILVAIFTAIAQFRRPEERWRHYRIINERYLDELWNYITLTGRYTLTDHDKALLKPSDDPNQKSYTGHNLKFQLFHETMARLRREEVTQFFGEVIPPDRPNTFGAQSGTPSNNTPTTP